MDLPCISRAQSAQIGPWGGPEGCDGEGLGTRWVAGGESPRRTPPRERRPVDGRWCGGCEGEAAKGRLHGGSCVESAVGRSAWGPKSGGAEAGRGRRCRPAVRSAGARMRSCTRHGMCSGDGQGDADAGGGGTRTRARRGRAGSRTVAGSGAARGGSREGHFWAQKSPGISRIPGLSHCGDGGI